MAYMNQDKKKSMMPQIKAVLKKYNMKGSVSVSNHSTLVVSLKSGSLDLITAANKYNEKICEWRGWARSTISDYLQVNPYHCVDNMREVGEEKIADFYEELLGAMHGVGSKYTNHDNSDIQSDYFDVGWYVDVNAGLWNKPYVCN